MGLSGVTLDNAPHEAIHLSITHENPLAIAMVILEREKEGEKHGEKKKEGETGGEKK